MARRTLNSQLLALAERRARAQAEIDRSGWEIGATATYLRDVLGQPKARSAEYARLSPSHMTELMKAAAEHSIVIDDPLKRIPFLQGAQLQSYVSDRGGLRRIVASFDEDDPLYMSQVDPSSFLNRDFGRGLRLPHMLVLTRADEWVAVDNVTVGYGGTGPSNALRELAGLGIQPELAENVAYSRVSDVDLDAPAEGLFTNSWPHVHLEAPTPIGDYFVVVVPTSQGDDEDDLPLDPRLSETDSSGFYGTPDSQPALRRWLAFLDAPDAPPWLRGTRRSRVYLDRPAAIEHGFTQTTLTPWNQGYRPHVFPVIIEQGRLQLWLDVPVSNDPTVLFSPEIYGALDQAGFYTADFRARDDQGTFWRWLRSLGAQRPTFVDLNDWALRFSPSADSSK